MKAETDTERVCRYCSYDINIVAVGWTVAQTCIIIRLGGEMCEKNTGC